MSAAFDELVEKAAAHLVAVHFDGAGCGDPMSTGACSVCFGGGHMSAQEVVGEVLTAIGLPALLERVEAAEARTADLWDEGFNAGFDVGTTAAAGLPTPRHDNPYRGDLATGTPFNDGEFFDNRKANDV